MATASSRRAVRPTTHCTASNITELCRRVLRTTLTTNPDDSLFNFNEFFSVMTPYVEAVAKNKASRISPNWKQGLQGILDSYLGKAPESFTYEGKITHRSRLLRASASTGPTMSASLPTPTIRSGLRSLSRCRTTGVTLSLTTFQ